MRVLVVEDDKIIGDGIVAGLEMEGYAVDWAEDIKTAEAALRTNDYSMMMLDLGLPDGSGLDLLKNLRTKKQNLPVLILTAYDDISLKVNGLDSGADDYLIKPFKLEELHARLRALHRRCEGRAEPVLQIGTIILNPATKQVTQHGKLINLGPKEFFILQFLMEKKERIISKIQLEESLYGWSSEIESNTIEVHIHGLRKKLGKEVIETVKYLGYRISEVR